MELISLKYKHLLPKILELAGKEKHLDVDSVYREANISIREIVDSVIKDNIKSGSKFQGFENIAKLFEMAQKGTKCLLLVEHYSNFDLPLVSYLLRATSSTGQDIANNLVAVAGVKLSQANRVVGAFSEAYSRLIIYPSRTINDIQANIGDPDKKAAELLKANAINTAAMKELARLRSSGKLILVFPAGTRFRPWDPESKRGVREIDSYLRSFDYMSLVTINGNLLHLNPNGEMLEDLVTQDKIIITASEPILCSQFRETVKKSIDEKEDKKQAVVDNIMQELEKSHQAIEKLRI